MTTSGPRNAALQVLAEKWPDETTRELLAQRAVKDDNEYPRSAALQALAENWPDETTRELLAQRAVKDDNEYPRSAALQALAENWPDETTRELLAQRAVQESGRRRHEVRPVAHAGQNALGVRPHPADDETWTASEPYLDPLEPIPRDHIQGAAERAGIQRDDLDATVAAISAHFGWDITVGARPSNE